MKPVIKMRIRIWENTGAEPWENNRSGSLQLYKYNDAFVPVWRYRIGFDPFYIGTYCIKRVFLDIQYNTWCHFSFLLSSFPGFEPFRHFWSGRIARLGHGTSFRRPFTTSVNTSCVTLCSTYLLIYSMSKKSWPIYIVSYYIKWVMTSWKDTIG